MSIIFLVRNYIPKANAVGVCVSHLSREFSMRGYSVTIICEKNDLKQIDKEQYEHEKVIRFISKRTAKRLHYEQKLISTNRLRKCFYFIALQCIRIENFLKAILSKSSIDNDLLNCFQQTLNCLSIASDDLIIPVSAPFESVYAVAKHKKNSNIDYCYIPLLYDLFKDCLFTNRGRFNRRIKFKENSKIENYSFKQCDGIISLDSWKGKIKSKNNIHFVDVPLLVKYDANIKRTVEHDPEKNILVYCGNFSNSIRKPTFFVDFMTQLLSVKANYELHLYGNGNQFKEIKKLHNRFPKQVFLHGFVEQSIVQQVQACADCLINVGNSNNDQIPSKIYNYMAMCKPIICLSNSINDLSLRTMSSYPLLISVVKDQHEGINQIIKRIDTISSQTVSFQEIRSCLYRATPSYTVEILLEYYRKKRQLNEQ